MSLSLFLWGIVLIAALALEWIGRKSGDKWLTLTDIIRKWVPPTIIIAALVWMAHHFEVVI